MTADVIVTKQDGALDEKSRKKPKKQGDFYEIRALRR
jgi:hypothetical protein